MLAFDGDDLIAAIELKSMSSSFGNNRNNRIEEALGTAFNTAHAIKNDLIRYSGEPPIFGYVMVVKDCDESRKTIKDMPSRYDADPVYSGTSDKERLAIMCKRMMAERVYQAVWNVCVDPVTGSVVEPVEGLTYEKFIARLSSQLAVHRA